MPTAADRRSTCATCGTEYWQTIGIKRNAFMRGSCVDCRNANVHKRKKGHLGPRPKKKKCLVCGTPCVRKYCSTDCMTKLLKNNAVCHDCGTPWKYREDEVYGCIRRTKWCPECEDEPPRSKVKM